MAKEAVVAATAWISVTLIIITIFWTPKQFDMFGALIIIFLVLAVPFVLTLILFRKEIAS
jgi:hypothetical protein